MLEKVLKILISFIMATAIIGSVPALANDGDGSQATEENPNNNPENDSNLSPIPVEVDKAIPSKTRASIPASYDLRSISQSTSVKNQNPYGACWTFGFVSSLETNLIKEGFNNNSVDLSERAIGYFSFNSTNDPKGLTNGDKLSYTTPDSSNNNWYNGGGTATQASLIAKKGSGLLNETDAPYGIGDVSSDKEYNGINKNVKNAYYINSTDISVIKEMIQTYGSGSVEFHATFDSVHYNYSTGAFFNDNKDLDFVSNHEVSIIGWVDNYSKTNFNSSCRPTSDGAFLCKNSWGSGWSKDGYFYISYEDACFTSVNKQPVVFVETENKNANESIYQYDGTSLPEKLEIASGSKIVTNYTIKDSRGTERIESISLLSYSSGVNYSIQVYKNPTNKSNPLTGEQLLTTPTVGTITKPGYLDIDLNEDIYAKNGDTMSIVITLNKPGGDDISVGVDKSGIYDDGDFGGWTSVNKTSPNQSLIIDVDNIITDLSSTTESVRVKMKTVLSSCATLKDTTKTLYKDDTYTLEATFYPSTNMATGWNSSDASIVSVDNNGKVTAKKEGNATITVIDNFGNQATCRIEVKQATLSVNKTNLNLTVGNNEKLEITSVPLASSKTCTTSNPNVATITNDGLVSAVGEGNATITIKDSYGNTKTVSVKVAEDVPTITYATHMQDKGWVSEKTNGTESGASGKRMEAIRISVDSGYQGEVQYNSFVQDRGWQGYVNQDEISGTVGKGKRIEAIKIKLTSVLATKYDIYYRVYVEGYGWMDWAKNDQSSGTGDMGKKIEFIQIKLIKKGTSFNEDTNNRYLMGVNYQSHVQNIGWQGYKKNGSLSGTTGRGLRVEAVKIKLSSDNSLSGNILYRSHVQNIGWQDGYKQNDEISGTSGLGLRVEAVRIKLDGKISEDYDVYYRVHVQNVGWQDWKKNDQVAGTIGKGLRIEAIEIKLERKQ